MKIIQLVAENVKRLSAVTIKPDGSAVIIGGDNGQGKTSVLDSIMYALAGGDSLPAIPLRKGQPKGQVSVDLGEYVVTRRFTRREDESIGSTLEIKTKKGFKASSPQAILDDLCGKMAFDPMEFSRLKAKAQLEALKELVGLDFTALDQRRAAIFEKRTDINRNAKAKAAELAACPKIEGVPEQEVSVDDLMAELERSQAINRAKHEKQSQVRAAEGDIRLATDACRRTITKIEDLKRQLAAAEQELREHEADRKANEEFAAKIRAEAAAMPEIECDPIHAKLRSADATNLKVRQNAKHRQLQNHVTDLEGDAADLTDQLNEIDGQKADMLAAAKFPVPGLGFDANGVTFNGLPFDEDHTSQEEIVRVSMAMGMALNPKLRIMLIRQGAFMDAKHLALAVQLAEQEDFQLWIERVGEGAECSVIIEDGHVKAAELEEATV